MDTLKTIEENKALKLEGRIAYIILLLTGFTLLTIFADSAFAETCYVNDIHLDCDYFKEAINSCEDIDDGL